jgi:uncharacterized protein (DUF1330 family)
MGEMKGAKTRREFVKAAGAAGALGMAAEIGGSRTAEAHEVDINALMPTADQLAAFIALPDGPIVMVNLLKFKPDGGAEDYAKYAAGVGPILRKIGARSIFAGEAKVCLIGGGDWDAIALVEYPDKMALIRMTQLSEYQAIHHHREAGLQGQINYAVIQMDVAQETS